MKEVWANGQADGRMRRADRVGDEFPIPLRPEYMVHMLQGGRVGNNLGIDDGQ